MNNVPVFDGPPPFTAADCMAEGATMSVDGFASRGTSEYTATDAFSKGRHEFHDTKHHEVTYSAVANDPADF